MSMPCSAAARKLSFALAIVVLLAATTLAQAQLVTLIDEDFADNPIGTRAIVEGDGSRFTYSGGVLTAAYDSALPTAKLNWSLGRTIDQDDPMRFTVDFRINSAGFQALQDEAMQIAFGLSNSATSGNDRTGDLGDFDTDTFDMITWDYFPNVSDPDADFPYQETLTPTLFGSQAGSSAFNNFNASFGPESSLDAEGPLPLDTDLTAIVEYDPFVGDVVLSMPGQFINAGGGADGMTDTIQMNVTATPFAFDQFSLLLFLDGFGGGSSTVAADVEFTGILVESVPEPASAALLGIAGLALLRRHNRRA